MPHLSLAGLSKSYGATRALVSAALDLRGGEVHALMGENGAGKSTLIRILAGLERADGGRITLDGAPLALDSPAAAEAAGLRFLHQELHVLPGLSVAENMHLSRPYPTRAGLVDWRALRRAAAAALDRLGAGHVRPADPIDRLGPGDQMLVRIAATLLPGGTRAPWAYVLDEPTAALTGAEVDRLFAAIDSLRAGGAAILYVSHRMEEVLRLADRVTVLRDGAHVSTHAIGDTGQARIIRDMTGRDMTDLYPPRPAAPSGPVRLALRGLRAGPLAGIELDVRRGEILGLAGLSGAGRNALLRALIGALPWQSGTATLDGAPMARSVAAAWAAGVAYVPRERRREGLMPGRALAETIVLPHLSALSHAGIVDQRRIADRVAALSATVRLKARGPDQPPAELSGGNQQKLLFARALAGAPRLLLLNEPTRGVDVGAKFDIYGLIRSLAAEGTTILIASSDLPELIGLSDRIALMDRGRVTASLPVAGLTEGALLDRLYDEAAA